jgi:hypothetical protein
MIRPHLPRRGINVTAYLLGFGASCSETTARWPASGIRHIAGENDSLASPLAHRIGDWRCRQQSLRIRMGGRFEDPVARRGFNDSTQVHYGDAIRHMAYDRQIVRDKEVCDSGAALNVLE